jgi:alginate O-acetyltransferase complex protein AlgI
MLFNSLLFLYRFLPLCLLIYFLVPKRLKNSVLLLASLVFYAWGGVYFTLVLAASIVLNYLTGLAIGRAGTGSGRKRALVAGIILNILLLAVFKYTGFALHNLNVLTGLLGWKPWLVNQVVLPLGISFYTFKALSYLIAVKRRETDVQRNFTELALYLAIFPQLIAGPIDRYRNLAGQIRERKETFALFASGVERFALGLFKKVIISGPIAYVADSIFSRPSEMLSTPMAWLGAACYTLQVYYDFSGYSDMAIGLGRMFGFQFSENFNFPYISRSIREFWRRWHITLSTWLRDYLFLPVAYSASRRMIHGRYAGIRTDHLLYVWATMVTFVLCGFWHGPAWHFVAWGFLHGLAMALERTPFGKWMERGFNPLAHVYVISFLVVSMVFFRADTLTGAVKFLGVMSGISGIHAQWPEFQEYFTREFLIMAAIAVLGSTPFFMKIRDRAVGRMGQPGATGAALLRYAWPAGSVLAVVVLLLFATMYLLSQTNTPFIYFRF